MVVQLIDDKAFDELCKQLSEKLLKQGETVSILSPEGIERFSKLYNAIQATLKKNGAKISYGINEPFIGSGFIRIIGRQIVFSDASVFAKYAKLATNFEVYPRVDGNICMAFSFDGLALTENK